MVCIYCTSPTEVVNSRHQRRTNTIWRRRRCSSCQSVFTTREEIDYRGALVFKNSERDLQPFSRDKLLMSIYESCRHRATVAQDAPALTQTILSNILRTSRSRGVIERDALIKAVIEVLERFDKAAATIYSAYHRL